MQKTVLITGASSGVGKASACYFADQGWNVVATMRNPSAGTVFKARANVATMRVDVEDRTSIESAVAESIKRFGALDVLVNNAGYGLYGLFEATSREQIEQQFNVNVFGVMDMMRAVLPHMRANKGGTIVNVSSGAGIFTLPLISSYCASKFALEGFSEAVSYELASQNIIVKIIEPHGGIASTNFGQRSSHEAASNTALPDYDAFVQRTNEAFATMRDAIMMDATDVARAIYEATTDGTTRLRYRVGDESRDLIRAHDDLSDEEYVAFMRARFGIGELSPR